MPNTWARLSDELRLFRDLVNDPPVRAHFLQSRKEWFALCDAMDAVDDRSDAAGKLDAVNELRRQVELSAVDDVEPGEEAAAALAALRAARAELEDRRNRLYEKLEAVSMVQVANERGSDYDMEKLAAVARGGTDRALGVAGATAWAGRLRRLREQMIKRGMEGWTDEVDDALYILERVDHFASDNPPAGRDLEVMTRYAFPTLVQRLRKLSKESDDSLAERRSGWEVS